MLHSGQEPNCSSENAQSPYFRLGPFARLATTLVFQGTSWLFSMLLQEKLEKLLHTCRQEAWIADLCKAQMLCNLHCARGKTN